MEDIEAILPGVVDPDCSSIPYVAYRIQLPSAPLEWHLWWYDMDVLAMGMTGFTVKVSICAMSSRISASEHLLQLLKRTLFERLQTWTI